MHSTVQSQWIRRSTLEKQLGSFKREVWSALLLGGGRHGIRSAGLRGYPVHRMRREKNKAPLKNASVLICRPPVKHGKRSRLETGQKTFEIPQFAASGHRYRGS